MKTDVDVLCSANGLSEDLAAAELGDRQRRGVGGLDDKVAAAVDHLALLLCESAPQDEYHALPAWPKGWQLGNVERAPPAWPRRSQTGVSAGAAERVRLRDGPVKP